MPEEKTSNQVIKDFLDSSAGTELKDIINKAVFHLASIDSIESTKPEDLAIEVLANKKALEQMKVILSSIMDFTNPEPKGRDPKDNYAVGI